MNMDYLITLFSVGSIICIGILIWMNTKSGKKWLQSL